MNVPNNLGNEISILDLILFFLIFIRISNERWEIERKIRVFASLAFAPLIDTVFDTVVHVLPAIPKSRPRGISVDLAPSHAGHSQIKLVTREAELQSTVAALCLNSLLPLTKASPARVSGDS